MAYSTSKFQLTHLLQDAWYRMGQLRTWVATGGTTTTVINTDWAGVEDEVYEDDDASLIYGTVVVARDAGGTGAAPEGEFGMITDYDSASQTITMDALTVAPAAGDRVAIASPLFPLEDMISLANIALRRIGEIDVVDTSLSVVGSQTEYTLPTTIRQRPTSVAVQTVLGSSNNNLWQPINFDVIPGAPGSNWTLVIPENTDGATLQVIYRGLHPELFGYASDIQETIHPELAVCALVAEAYQWFNNRTGGSNQYFLQRENKALQDLAQARMEYPIRKLVGKVNGLPHWGRRGDYVPLTSDLRS